MATKKITLNELRSLVQKIIKEEIDNQTFDKLDELKKVLEEIGIKVEIQKDINKKEYITIYPEGDPYLSHNSFFIDKNGNYEMGNWYYDGEGEKAITFYKLEDIIKYVKKNNYTTKNDKIKNISNKNPEEWLSPLQRIKKYGR